MASVTGALAFILPAILAAFATAVLISGLFRLMSYLARDKPADAVAGFFDVLRVSLGFGGFAMVLGIFVGLTENLLIVTALGTVTTLGSTYLAYLYGKDAASDSKQILVPSLLTFFVTVPLTMEYTRLFLHP